MVLRIAKPTREERAAMSRDELLRTVWLLDEVIESFRWIPVSERLPEDGTYLCTLEGELCGLEEPFTGMCGIEKGNGMRKIRSSHGCRCRNRIEWIKGKIDS